MFADGSQADFEAVVLATGFRPALEDFIDVPGVVDTDGFPLDFRGGGACPHLYFVGFASVPSGLLREIAIEAEQVAREIAPEDGRPRRVLLGRSP